MASAYIPRRLSAPPLGDTLADTPKRGIEMKNIRMLGFAAVAATALATGALAAAAMSSDDKIAATGGDIQIHAIHHAALTLTHGNQRILVDPAPAPGAPQGSDPTTEYKAMPAPTIIL